MSKLREQMLADMQLKGITPGTQKKYLREVSNFAKYFGKSPEELGEKGSKGVSGLSVGGEEVIQRNVSELRQWHQVPL